MGRRGVDSDKPKGRMSSYAYFVQTCRAEHKRKHPTESVVFTEFAKKCSERWKTMSDLEKQRFQDMAGRDKERYETEMSAYNPQDGSGGRKRKRKQKKDPNAPKRCMSAFFWFSQDVRPSIMKEHPQLRVGDVAKILSKQWAVIPPETKSKYEAIASRDRQRYVTEKNTYKSRGASDMVATGSAAGSGIKKGRVQEGAANAYGMGGGEDDDDEDDDLDDDDE
ncbi:PREDICTED: high mobility group protein DSP1-like [Priapulus caudatus]|uniref:High mobility group protein DSP1-like n=1 Tax=Priapulus caudatus TaxID=37621 RepID=A0ABM1ER97_PRICU|nr:PREDICTED: high mobility group protein DSP1-like [Priapulus caudatus]XP_014674719.1 PREDICTED: high mobility group protein DSP1-like [Priapulus caudatus]